MGSHAMNWCLAGIGLVMILTQPARQIVNEDLLYRQDLSVTFYDRDDNFLGRRGIKLDDSRQLTDYPDYLLQAVLATEDRRFYHHFGIDPVGILRAVISNSHGGHTQGASTITQQLAKNLFLSNERSLQRKISEAYIALWLEQRLSKDQIFKMYLDRAYMGGGVHGITEAARYYFNKELADISLSEAAALASMFKAPNKYNPELHPDNNAERRQVVLQGMVDQAYITEAERQVALEFQPYIHRHQLHYTSDWYLDHVYSEVQRLWSSGRLGSNRVLHVYTGLDPRIQQASENTVTRMLDIEGDRMNADQAAVVVLDNTGLVVAMVGGADYGDSSFNRATHALRQPGSSFKPYVYATAIEAGLITKDTVMTDRPVCIGRWCPHNYGGKFGGSTTVANALAHSYNSIPVQLSIQLSNPYGSIRNGRQKIIDMAHRLGVQTQLYDSQSLPIGSVEMTVLDQATGYAALASGGYRVGNHSIRHIHSSDGQQLWRYDVKPEKVLSDQVVHQMNFMMNRVVEAGTGTAARIPNQIISGKTGTSNNYRDAWFVGYTGRYTTAVWYGNDDNTSTANMTGGSLPARTWREIMTVALAGLPPVPPAGMALPPEPKVAAKEKSKAQPPAKTVVATAETPVDRPFQETESESGIGRFFKKIFGAE